MTEWITGETKLVGLLGWPVEHSRSPQMQNAALRHARTDAAYVPLGVPPEELAEALAGLRAMRFVGCNVTIPHKQGVLSHMATLTPEAEAIGAVNTIRVEEDGSLTGHNTDCLGAVRAVEEDGTRVRGKTVAILGAGGAARGVAAGCAFAGADRIIVLNRTVERAQELIADLSSKIALDPEIEWEAGPLQEGEREGWPDWDGVDIVFQMTSMGMRENTDIPLDPGLLKKSCHLLEAVYSPLQTPFLKAGRAKGLRTTDGLAMLLEQGAASFEFWFGRQPNREVMREALASGG